MKTLGQMLEAMYRLAVWDNKGRQYLPVWDYEWRDVENYMPAEEAIVHNVTLWLNDEKEGDHGTD